MRTLKTIFVILCFVALSINSNAQTASWTSPNTSTMTLDPMTANVGIGTSNPLEKLHVNGKFFLERIGSGVSYFSYLHWNANTLIMGTPVGTYAHNSVDLMPGGADEGGLFSRLRMYTATGPNQQQLKIEFNSEQDCYFNNIGNVGIGTTNPIEKLHVNGKFFLERIGSGVSYFSYLHWNANTLIMGTPVGTYAHNSVDLMPGGANEGGLFSRLRMYNATGPDQQQLKIEFNSEQDCYFNNTGNVGIGLTNPTTKLDVAGVIRAHEVKVCLNQGCDYVFADDYKLMNLSDLNHFIKTNRHLPEVAPAAVMEAEGINVSEMNALLLKKIEELTLYVIELKNEIENLKK